VLVAQYLNCFVLVVQSFLKLPPRGASPQRNQNRRSPIARASYLLLFIVLGVATVKRFRPVRTLLPVETQVRVETRHGFDRHG
jgi:hypothetical protein